MRSENGILTTHGRRVHPSIMWAKLKALTGGADLATKELWDLPRARAVA
jgi:hypothetical protein